MPVEFYQTCQGCHVSKPRASNFPSRVVSAAPVTHAIRRRYLPYCYDCLKADPSLYRSVGVQQSDYDKESDAPPTS